MLMTVLAVSVLMKIYCNYGSHDYKTVYAFLTENRGLVYLYTPNRNIIVLKYYRIFLNLTTSDRKVLLLIAKILKNQ